MNNFSGFCRWSNGVGRVQLVALISAAICELLAVRTVPDVASLPGRHFNLVKSPGFQRLIECWLLRSMNPDIGEPYHRPWAVLIPRLPCPGDAFDSDIETDRHGDRPARAGLHALQLEQERSAALSWWFALVSWSRCRRHVTDQKRLAGYRQPDSLEITL